MGEVSCDWMEQFTVVCSCGRQNLTFGYFTLLFLGIRRRNILKCMPLVQTTVFSSFIQSYFCSLALSPSLLGERHETIVFTFLQMPEERNYHIFYRLLAGLTADEKARLHLTVAKDYHYLSQGNCLACEGMDDKQQFADIRRAMKVI